MEANSASLRSTAAQWSLAGDKQLLDILQNIHQSLVTRCQEVNRKLDEMVTALDGASVDLQNVNNKFMALSNSQFIESRVYDDDVDVVPTEQPKTAEPGPQPSQELERLQQSIRVLESSHDLIEILDSDSDASDDEEPARTVLKPKDMYGHRPLPYIIGSQPWRNKWHAGLHPEDSDSESSASVAESEYSDDEPPRDVTHAPRAQAEVSILESTASSELQSEQESNVGSLPTAGSKPTPSDIAAELARRLGGDLTKIPVEEAEYSPPSLAKKQYRPDQPSAGTVFCDEPPPLDHYQSTEDIAEEDDIFAELHKSKPYSHGNKDQSRLAEDLFSGLGAEEGDIFSDFRESKVTSTPSTDKPLFPEHKIEPRVERVQPHLSADAVKKPVGGISLFGSNKGAESIGAAILKRNQRHSSEEDSDVTPPQTEENTRPKNKEKDIFDDLFAKSEREQKSKEIAKGNPKPKVDLFSDNIFDDIDDIFTSNVNVSKKETKNNKPLFDEDDDLFSDIAVAKTTKSEIKTSEEKSIFDSDDDLFAESVKKTSSNKASRETKDLTTSNNRFGNVDDIFADIVENNEAEPKSNIVNVVSEEITKATDKVGVIDNSKKQTKSNVNLGSHNYSDVDKVLNENEGNGFKSRGPNNNIEKSAKSVFDDENDDELFAKDSKILSSSDENSNLVNSDSKLKSDVISSKETKKLLLFDDESDDNELFASTSKIENSDNNVISRQSTGIPNKTVVKNVNANVNNKEKSSIFDDDIDTEDIFATTSKKSNSNFTNPAPIVSEINKASVENIEKPKLKNKSLFDDEDSDDSNLFNNVNKKPETEQKPIIQKQTLSKKERNLVKNEDDEEKSVNTENNLVEPEKHTKNEQKSTSKAHNLVTNEMSLNTNETKINQKPTINDHKPKLQEKPTVKQDKPIVKEQKSKEAPIEDVIQEKEQISKIDNKSKVVDSKVPIDKDNNAKEVSTTQKQDNLFTPTQESKSDLNAQPVEYKIPDLDKLETTSDNKVDEEKDALFSPPHETLFSTPAVFDDIFREPPAFEKSVEPKKSKNVNALFDDDSDDEALFFKKNDAILDEKPDLSADSNKDALFGIFHDEPPAIEVDFTQKASKSNFNADSLKSDSDDDLFGIKSQNESLESSQSSQITIPDIPTKIDSNTKSEIKDAAAKSIPVLDKAGIFEQKSKSDVNPPKDAIDSDSKKVGKLKTMNFNIDVSTLLPGASPKKKAVEQTDGQIISTKTNENTDNDALKVNTDVQTMFTKSQEDLHTKDNIEPNVLKSVSFDGEPDSNILDNKLSKQRARIQVKRRPSTRRARKEAVLKSTIDLADDSTDNSSSIDDAKSRSEKERNTEIDTQTKKVIKSEADEEKCQNNDTINDETSKLETNKLDSAKTKTKIKPQCTENEPEESKDTIDSKYSNIDESLGTETEYKQSEYKNKNVTSKIVYILNDEDIFSTPNVENPQKSKVLNIIDDNDDDLFKNIPKSSENIPGISTLGNAYKDIASDIEREVKSTINKRQSEVDSPLFRDSNPSQSKNSDSLFDVNKATRSKVDSNTYTIDSDETLFKDTKATKSRADSNNIDSKSKSLFDNLSDEENELFNSTNSKAKSSKAKNILDSDSEDDLFSGRKKKTEVSRAVNVKETEVKQIEVKSSLFGDDDDEDDLFAVKVKSNVASAPPPTRSAKENPKTSEPVFDDPLSLLGGEDD